jgi:hypothetical protein
MKESPTHWGAPTEQIDGCPTQAGGGLKQYGIDDVVLVSSMS